jgi:hypothetical protein
VESSIAILIFFKSMSQLVSQISQPMNALEFFQKEFRWKSRSGRRIIWRLSGEKGWFWRLAVGMLYTSENPKTVALCEMHEIDPKVGDRWSHVMGRCSVDKEDGEQHAGERCLRWAGYDETGDWTAFKREGLCGNCSGEGR